MVLKELRKMIVTGMGLFFANAHTYLRHNIQLAVIRPYHKINTNRVIRSLPCCHYTVAYQINNWT